MGSFHLLDRRRFCFVHNEVEDIVSWDATSLRSYFDYISDKCGTVKLSDSEYLSVGKIGDEKDVGEGLDITSVYSITLPDLNTIDVQNPPKILKHEYTPIDISMTSPKVIKWGNKILVMLGYSSQYKSRQLVFTGEFNDNNDDIIWTRQTDLPYNGGFIQIIQPFALDDTTVMMMYMNIIIIGKWTDNGIVWEVKNNTRRISINKCCGQCSIS